MLDTSSEDEFATYDFDEEFQDKIAGILSRDTSFAKRVSSLVEPDYFSNRGMANFVKICLDHIQTHGVSPDLTTVKHILADLRKRKIFRDDQFDELKDAVKRAYKADITNASFVATEVATFAQHQAIQNAMIASIPMLERGEFSAIRDLMATATRVGLADEFQDYDYYVEIASRTQKREDIATGKVIRTGITTGYAKLDTHLYHYGWGRKELSCIMGPAKSGKSLSLGDFAKNASLAGYNVLYVSLEVAKEIISERIDAALSDTLMSDLINDRAKVDAAITAAHAKAGTFKVIDFASGTLKVSAFDRVIMDYRDRGHVFDLIIVDYADIMCPERGDDDLREGLRKIYIELRALAHKYDCAVLTATQTNREGAKSATSKATDVGDDWNKVRTVDILIGLNATEEEKSVNEMRLKWLASRNTADGFTIRIKQNRQKMQFLTEVLGIE